jgi:hypothetical protein
MVRRKITLPTDGHATAPARHPRGARPGVTVLDDRANFRSTISVVAAPDPRPNSCGGSDRLCEVGVFVRIRRHAQTEEAHPLARADDVVPHPGRDQHRIAGDDGALVLTDADSAGAFDDEIDLLASAVVVPFRRLSGSQ